MPEYCEISSKSDAGDLAKPIEHQRGGPAFSYSAQSCRVVNESGDASATSTRSGCHMTNSNQKCLSLELVNVIPRPFPM